MALKCDFFDRVDIIAFSSCISQKSNSRLAFYGATLVVGESKCPVIASVPRRRRTPHVKSKLFLPTTLALPNNLEWILPLLIMGLILSKMIIIVPLIMRGYGPLSTPKRLLYTTAARIYHVKEDSIRKVVLRSRKKQRNSEGRYNSHGGNNKILNEAQEEAIRQYCYEQWEMGLGASHAMVFAAICHLRNV
jgi:hypothetical protein